MEDAERIYGLMQKAFAKLSQQRRAKGWSTYEMAEKSGLHQTQVVRLEAGDVAAIRKVDEYLTQLSRTLGISPEDLVGGRRCIEHLSPELQEFVMDPANEKAIKRAYLESELRKMDEPPKT